MNTRMNRTEAERGMALVMVAAAGLLLQRRGEEAL